MLNSDVDSVPKKSYVAYCEDCNIKTEDRHDIESALELCELHNHNSDGCEAEPKPVCWVCLGFATHRNTKPPYSYLCEDHAFDIDVVSLEEWEKVSQ